MPRTGETYAQPAGTTAVAGQPIESAKFNTLVTDIADALTGSLARAGGTMAGNIAMGGFKLTGLAAGTTAGDSVRYEQVTSAVAITGGTIAGITDLPIADGGTGASTAANAFAALKQAATTTATGVVELATAAEYRTGTDTGRVPAIDQIWAAAAEVTLTDAATIAVDFSTFINAVVTLGGNRALGNPTNEKVGQSGCIRIVQDGTGTRTLSYGGDWEFVGGTAPVLSTTAANQDLLFYHIIAPNRIFASLNKDIS
jgi:hypothetical protein